MTAVIKPMPLRSAVEGGYSLDDFEIDEKARTIPVAKARDLTANDLVDKIVTGVLYKNPGMPEFQRSYAAIVARAQEDAAKGGKR